MKSHFTRPLLCLGILAASPSIANAQGVRDGYKTPLVTVPYLAQPPVLDGHIDEKEWQYATSLNALQTPDHSVSARQTRFWLGWDAENLYIAMRSPLRRGERPMQAMRELGRDINVVFDDSYEIWLDAGTHSADGQPVFFQFLSNIAGARYDVMQEPAVGNSRLGWTSNWQPHNSLVKGPDGDAWEMEIAIPRRSLFLDKPFQSGNSFTGLLSRNYKRPWEQNTLAGTGSFSVRETYACYVLVKDAPTLHLRSVGDLAKRTFGLDFDAIAPTGKPTAPVKWTFRGDSGVKREGTLALKAGQTATTGPLLNLETPGDGDFRLQVTSGATTLLDWSARRNWGGLEALDEKLDDKGDHVDLTLNYNPVHNYLRVKGDFINYDARAQIARYLLKIEDSAGKLITSKDFALDKLAYVGGVDKLPPLKAGKYRASLTAYNRAGGVILTRNNDFTKRDPAKEFPWWNTKLGNADKVLSPWTPGRYNAGRFDIWGRSMRFGDAGLPSQILTQKSPLLAAPARLEVQLADGSWHSAQNLRLDPISQHDNRAVVRARATLAGLQIDSEVTVEYDGLYKVALKMTPQKALAIKNLRLVFPIRPERADFLHATGEGIRYGFDTRFLPKNKNGRIWDSHKVDGQPMKVGSFIPYLWVGNTEGGLCWFADSDEGWVPNDKTPAIEIRHDQPQSTDLVLNLISSDFNLATPRTVVFGLQATPVKPLRSGWRMDSWWTNDSFQDWAQVESKGAAGNMGLIFSSLPFPLDPAKSREMVEARHKTTNEHIFGFEKYRANAVPYLEHINMGSQFIPEFPYFEEEWRTNVSRGLSYGPTLSDFMVYHLSQWTKQSGIDGIYIDNVFPIADDNIEAGRGYHLPNGQIQPTYQMFDTRRYFLRLRAAFAEQGKQGKFVVHMTNNMIMPWVGAADIALDGEHHIIYPELGKDFMDFWSMERMRADVPAQWGVAVNFLQEYQGNWDQTKLKKAMRAYTGMMLLHDVLPSANANGLNPEVWGARERFGLAADDVRFVGPWQKENGLQSPTSGVYLSAWRRPNKALVAVVNTGEARNVVVNLNLAKLELNNPKLIDAETNAALAINSNGQVTLPVARHDYRLIVCAGS